MTDVQREDPNRIQPFDEFFAEVAGGIPNQEMTAALSAVAQEVIHLKKKGAVTLTIEVLPADDAGQQVYVTSRVKATPPEPKPFPALFFTGASGGLHKEDPFRLTLPGIVRTPDEPAVPRLPVSESISDNDDEGNPDE